MPFMGKDPYDPLLRAEVANLQCGFLNVIVIPYWRALDKACSGALSAYMEVIELNKKGWETIAKGESPAEWMKPSSMRKKEAARLAFCGIEDSGQKKSLSCPDL
jgi:hypothetical protein